MKKVKYKYQSGGSVTSLGSTLDSALGFLNPALGVVSAAVPIITSLFRGPDHTVVSASPGNYKSGGSGIHINPKNKGKFNALKKRTGKTTEELTHSKNPLTRKRAIFAQNAAKWHHDTGGLIYPNDGAEVKKSEDIFSTDFLLKRINDFSNKQETYSAASGGQIPYTPDPNAFKPWQYGDFGFAEGGDIPLNSGAFQVQGNPSVTDGNTYGNVSLDHNEVISQTKQGNQFVFSDDLKHPSGKSYALLAKKHEKAKGKAEKMLKLYPNDEQAKSTISQSNAALDLLASTQEAQATNMGLRNPDGSTKQHYADGGPTDPPLNSETYQVHQVSTQVKSPIIREINRPLANTLRMNELAEQMRMQEGATKRETVQEIKRLASINDNYYKRSYASGGPTDPPQYMSIPGQPNYYYDPKQDLILYRNSNGTYRSVGSGANSKFKPAQADIDRFLNQGYVGPGPLADPLQGMDTFTNPTPTPSKKLPYNSPIKAKPQISPTSSGVPQWLTDARDFMKQVDDTDELNNPEGLPPSSPIPIPENRFGQLQKMEGAIPTQKEDIPTDFNRPTPTPAPSSKYKTPWTIGDTLKVIELGAKGINAFSPAEKEKPLLDNTQITQQSYDPTNALYQNQRNYSNFVNNTSAASVNLRRGILNSALASRYNSDNQIMSQYNQLNQNAKTEYQNRLSNQRQFNVQSQFRTNDINAANRAAQDAVQQNFFTSLGQFGEDLNRKRFASDSVNLMSSLYPDVFNSYLNLIGNGK